MQESLRGFLGTPHVLLDHNNIRRNGKRRLVFPNKTEIKSPTMSNLVVKEKRKKKKSKRGRGDIKSFSGLKQQKRNYGYSIALVWDRFYEDTTWIVYLKGNF